MLNDVLPDRTVLGSISEKEKCVSNKNLTKRMPLVNQASFFRNV